MFDLCPLSESSITSGLHRYAGDVAQLKLRLLFTDVELISKRPTLTANKLRYKNQDQNRNQNKQQARSSGRVNNNNYNNELNHHSSFLIEQKQGRWTIEREIGDAIGGDCKPARLNGLYLHIATTSTLPTTKNKSQIDHTTTSNYNNNNNNNNNTNNNNQLEASESRVHKNEQQHKEEGDQSDERGVSVCCQQQCYLNGINEVVDERHQLKLTPRRQRFDLSATSSSSSSSRTLNGASLTKKKRAFNWKDTATVTSDNNDRQRTLARKLPYEIRNHQLEHCNYQHHKNMDKSNKNEKKTKQENIINASHSHVIKSDTNQSCGSCSQLTSCLLASGATEQIGQERVCKGPPESQTEEQTDWYQDCLLNDNRDLAFIELARQFNAAAAATATTTTTRIIDKSNSSESAFNQPQRASDEPNYISFARSRRVGGDRRRRAADDTIKCQELASNKTTKAAKSPQDDNDHDDEQLKRSSLIRVTAEVSVAQHDGPLVGAVGVASSKPALPQQQQIDAEELALSLQLAKSRSNASSSDHSQAIDDKATPIAASRTEKHTSQRGHVAGFRCPAKGSSVRDTLYVLMEIPEGKGGGGEKLIENNDLARNFDQCQSLSLAANTTMGNIERLPSSNSDTADVSINLRSSNRTDSRKSRELVAGEAEELQRAAEKEKKEQELESDRGGGHRERERAFARAQSGSTRIQQPVNSGAVKVQKRPGGDLAAQVEVEDNDDDDDDDDDDGDGGDKNANLTAISIDKSANLFAERQLDGGNQTSVDRGKRSPIAADSDGISSLSANRWMQQERPVASNAGSSSASIPMAATFMAADSNADRAMSRQQSKLVCLAVIVIDKLNRFIQLKPDLNELISVDISAEEREHYHAGLSGLRGPCGCAAGFLDGSIDYIGSGLVQHRQAQSQQMHSLSLFEHKRQQRQSRHPQSVSLQADGAFALFERAFIYQLELALDDGDQNRQGANDNDNDNDIDNHKSEKRSTKAEIERALSFIYNKLIENDRSWQRFRASSLTFTGITSKWLMMEQEIPEKTAPPPFISPLNGNQLIMLQFDFHFASHFNNDCSNLYVKYKLMLKDNLASRRGRKWKLIPRLEEKVGAKQETKTSFKLNNNISLTNDNDQLNYGVGGGEDKSSSSSSSSMLLNWRLAASRGNNLAQMSHQRDQDETINNSGRAAKKDNQQQQQLVSTLNSGATRLGGKLKLSEKSIQAANQWLNDDQLNIDDQINTQPLANYDDLSSCSPDTILLQGSTVTSRPDGVGRFRFACLERLLIEVVNSDDLAANNNKTKRHIHTIQQPTIQTIKPHTTTTKHKASRSTILSNRLPTPLHNKTQKSLDLPDNDEKDNLLAVGNVDVVYDGDDNAPAAAAASKEQYDKEEDNQDGEKLQGTTLNGSQQAQQAAATSTNNAALLIERHKAKIFNEPQASSSAKSANESRSNDSEKIAATNEQLDRQVVTDYNHEIKMENKFSLDNNDKTSVVSLETKRRQLNEKGTQDIALDRAKVNLETNGKQVELLCSTTDNNNCNDDDEQCELILLLEFYSSNFYRDTLQGWSHLDLPVCLRRSHTNCSCCVVSLTNSNNFSNTNTAAVNNNSCQRLATATTASSGATQCKRTRHVLTVIRPELISPIDKLRYYLIGQMPSSTPTIESFARSNHRYMLQTRECGRIELDCEIARQQSILEGTNAEVHMQRYSPRKGTKFTTDAHDKERTPVEMENEIPNELNTKEVVEAYRKAKHRLAELKIDSLLSKSNLLVS